MERDPSIIFSRAFLRREPGGVRGVCSEQPQLWGTAPHLRPHLSSSRTSSTVWPVTTNTSLMSSVSILQE